MSNEHDLIDESEIDSAKLLPVEQPRFSSPPMPPPPVPEIPVTVAFGSQMPPTIKQTPPFGPAVPTIPLMKIAPAGSANTNAVAAPAQNKANSAVTLAGKANTTAMQAQATAAIANNKNLDAIKDGTERFAASVSTVTYRPTSNPLTALDAGSNATVNIAAFDMAVRTQNVVSDVAYNSGSITGLSYSTLYYLYLDDASLSGGTVTYFATVTKSNTLSSTSFMFIGSIITPEAGQADTVGNNDGGTTAAIGTTTIYKPSSSSTTSGIYTNPTFAYDDDESTAATNSGTASVITFTGFPGIRTPMRSELNVCVEWQQDASSTPNDVLSYSTDGGSTFTVFQTITTGPVARRVDRFAIPVLSNLALTQIRVSLTTGAGITNKIWETWVEELT